MPTYPTTGSTPWNATLRTYVDDADSASAWSRAPRVVDMQFPLLIAHRGGADLGAENSVDAYRNSILLGYTAVEAGDVQALADGTLVIMHDATVDRTTTGTGNVNSFTKATWATLSIDVAGAWGGAYTNVPVPFWDDALAALAGRCVLVPEVKDQLDSTATAMCDRLDALGLKDSTIITSGSQTNMAIAAARGYKTQLVGTTFAGMLGVLTFLKANNIWSVALDYTQADFTAANVAALQAAGLRVFVYTLDHQASYAAAIAKGIDGLFTNEGIYYVTSNTAVYRKTATSWHMSGRWEQGDLGYGDGPMSATARGSFIGVPGAYRFKASTANRGMIVGNLCPVANAASTYTVSVGVAIDTIPTTTTNGPAIYCAMPDDSMSNTADQNNSYMVKVRASGGVQMWEINGSNVATSLGTSTCTAMQNLTLTAAMTGGSTLTTMTVSALTVALKVGHQFLLPTGQIATINAAAAIGATSLTILSLIPSATVAISAVLVPYVTITFNCTPTTVNASRGDETSVAAISAANTAHRGGYFSLANSTYGTGNVSYHKCVVT